MAVTFMQMPPLPQWVSPRVPRRIPVCWSPLHRGVKLRDALTLGKKGRRQPPGPDRPVGTPKAGAGAGAREMALLRARAPCSGHAV